MTEVRMKNVFRMHIHPIQMGAIRQSKVKQLFLNARPGRLKFGGIKRPFLIFQEPKGFEFTVQIMPPPPLDFFQYKPLFFWPK